MTGRAARRLAAVAGMLLAVSVISFALTALAPGDPAEDLLRRGGSEPNAASVAAVRAELGLDDPIAVRYGRWLSDVVRGELGRSYVTGRPVSEELLARTGPTVLLATVSFVLTILLAVPLALAAVFARRTGWDRAGRRSALALGAIPPYGLGVVLIAVVAVPVSAVPTGGLRGPASILLPALALALTSAATLFRLLRAELLEVAGALYVDAARAVGVPESRIARHHALRPAAPPMMSAAAIVCIELLAGAVVVETLFSWPGLGNYAVRAIQARDIPVIQGYVLLTATLSALVVFTVDLAIARVAPWTRHDR